MTTRSSSVTSVSARATLNRRRRGSRPGTTPVRRNARNGRPQTPAVPSPRSPVRPRRDRRARGSMTDATIRPRCMFGCRTRRVETVEGKPGDRDLRCRSSDSRSQGRATRGHDDVGVDSRVVGRPGRRVEGPRSRVFRHAVESVLPTAPGALRSTSLATRRYRRRSAPPLGSRSRPRNPRPILNPRLRGTAAPNHSGDDARIRRRVLHPVRYQKPPGVCRDRAVGDAAGAPPSRTQISGARSATTGPSQPRPTRGRLL